MAREIKAMSCDLVNFILRCVQTSHFFYQGTRKTIIKYYNIFIFFIINIQRQNKCTSGLLEDLKLKND